MTVSLWVTSPIYRVKQWMRSWCCFRTVGHQQPLSTVERRDVLSPGGLGLCPGSDLHHKCDLRQGSGALICFLSIVDDTCLPQGCVSYSILWVAKCCQMSGVFYIRKTCIAQDKLISRKLISPWLLRFRMDLDCISSSIFLWMVLLKFRLDFVLATDFWQRSHRNELQLGVNFRLQVDLKNVPKYSTWESCWKSL